MLHIKLLRNDFVLLMFYSSYFNLINEYAVYVLSVSRKTALRYFASFLLNNLQSRLKLDTDTNRAFQKIWLEIFLYFR